MPIQSVLDVKDDNPLNKSQGMCFNRSILILTPQRALKFTAINQERHYVWLSALSFLSTSPNDISNLGSAPMSIPIEEESAAPPPLPTRSSRRPAIRDSIRVAKSRGFTPGVGPGQLGGLRAFTDGSVPRIGEVRLSTSQLQLQQGSMSGPEHEKAADAPNVPRTSTRTSTHSSAHSRKRSNTAPRPLPSSLRTFPSIDHQPSITSFASSMTSTTTTGPQQIYPPVYYASMSAGPSSAPPISSAAMAAHHALGSSSSNYSGGGAAAAPSVASGPSGTNTGFHSTRSSISRRTSLSSGIGAMSGGSYFEGLGTVRMEAFINGSSAQQNKRGGHGYGDSIASSNLSGASGSASVGTGGLGSSGFSQGTGRSAPTDRGAWGSIGSGSVASTSTTGAGAGPPIGVQHPPVRSYRTRHGRKKDMSYWGAPSGVSTTTTNFGPSLLSGSASSSSGGANNSNTSALSNRHGHTHTHGVGGVGLGGGFPGPSLEHVAKTGNPNSSSNLNSDTAHRDRERNGYVSEGVSGTGGGGKYAFSSSSSRSKILGMGMRKGRDGREREREREREDPFRGF